MADIAQIELSKSEEKFRKSNQWHSFTAAVYTAVGSASFFGALMTIAQATIAGAAGVGTGAEFAAALLAPLPVLAIGGLIALGTASLYMAQRENTKLKSIQDTHLAEENARCNGRAHGVAPSQAQEYDQNCRADGKQWSQVVKQPVTPGVSAAIH